MSQTKVQLVGNVVTGANFTGILSASSYSSDDLSVGVAATISSVTISSGIVSATSFYGDATSVSNISAGSTVLVDNSTNSTFYPIITQETTGTLTSTPVSTTKLSFNPSSSKLNVGSGVTFESGNISIATTITAANISIPLGLG